jgi:sulfur-carrier protein
MNNINVTVPPSIRPFVSGQSRVTVSAQTVRGALVSLCANSPDLKGHLFDAKDQINRFVRVFVNGRPLPLGSRGEEVVDEGAELTIVLALAGG